jgi:hypothetical protein
MRPLPLFIALAAAPTAWADPVPRRAPPIPPDPGAPTLPVPDPDELPEAPDEAPPEPIAPARGEPTGDLLAPVLVACPEVPYPAGLDAGAQHVEVVLLVDEAGAVETVTPVAGAEPLLALVTEAVRGCTFQAASEGGEPIAVEIPFGWDFPEPPINVAGVIRAAGDRRPVEDLPLVVGDRVVRTDEEGVFELRNLPPGTYDVRVGDPGWRLPTITFDLPPGERVDLELFAIATGEVDEAVGVYRVGKQTQARRTLSANEIRTLPGTMGDPVRALANAPGVVRTPFDAGWLLVRGGDPDDTAVFLDGVEVPLLFHLGGLVSIFHPEMVDEVRLEPGAFSSRYGSSTSGIVDLVPLRPAGDLRATGGVNLAFSQAFVETPLGPGALAVAARRSYLDAVMRAVLDAQRAKIAPRFWDWQARYDTDSAGVLAFGLSDTIDAPTGEDDETVTVTQRATQLQGRVERAFGEDTRLQIRPWIAVQARDLVTDARVESEKQLFPGARAELTTTLPGPAGGWDLLVGAEGEGRRYSVARDGSSRQGTYGRADPYAEVGVGEVVRATAGVRLETLFVNDQIPRGELSPRGSLRWQATEEVALVAEAGRVHNAPGGLFLVGFDEGSYMRLERAEFASAGIRTGDPKLAFDADIWTRRMERLYALEKDETFGAFEGRAWGLETLTRMDLGDLDVRMVVQWVRSDRREEHGDGWEPLRYDQPLLVQLVGLQQLPKEWTLSGRWRYAAGYPLVPGADDAYDILTQTDIEIEADKNGRLPPYHALDAKISKRVTYKAWRLDVYLDVQNAYLRRVPEPAINGIDDNEPVYGWGLPILPIFGIDGVFWP